MKGLLGEGCRARNNEEYRLVLAKRKKRLWMWFAFAVVTSVVALIMEYGVGVADDAHYYTGFALGLGVGMAAASLGGIAKIRKILKDEEKLKEERLKETDERENEVNSQALKMTAKILLVALYVLLIAGALFSHSLMYVCFGLIILFLLCFAVLKRYYENKL